MNHKTNSAFVATPVIPARVINIAVDTAYLYSQTSGPYAGTGIYMMDNNAAGGSTGTWYSSWNRATVVVQLLILVRPEKKKNCAR